MNYDKRTNGLNNVWDTKYTYIYDCYEAREQIN